MVLSTLTKQTFNSLLNYINEDTFTMELHGILSKDPPIKKVKITSYTVTHLYHTRAKLLDGDEMGSIPRIEKSMFLY